MLTPTQMIVKGSRTSFYYAMQMLPRERREAMYAVYAFCRAVDDIVDEPTEGQASARERLNRWRRDVAACYDGGTPADPVAQALAPVVRRYDIPQRLPLELIAGMEMDLECRRYPTFDELRLYCWRVASVVGLMAIRIFGYRHAQTERFAEELGIALQLTNILRDVGSDGERGRVYLPLEDLVRFGVREEDLLAKRRNAAWTALMQYECERARGAFASAQSFFVPEEGRTLYPALIMGAIYRRILARIERSGYDVFDRKIAVPRCEQVAVAVGLACCGRWGWGRTRLAEALR